MENTGWKILEKPKSGTHYPNETPPLVVGAYCVIFYTFAPLDYNMCNM